MTTADRSRPAPDEADAPVRFGAESMDFDEAFGFPRVAGDKARARFGVSPGDRVLDVGCGTGALLRFLLPALEGRGAMVGVDRDPDLLGLAAKEMEAAAEAAGVEVGAGGVKFDFQPADALDLPFDDDAFDAVVSMFLLCILPEPRGALDEMVRVTRPGGTVASLSCFCKSGGLPRFHGVAGWEGRDRWEALDRRFREVYRTTVRNPGLGLPNGEDLAVWGATREAGLEEPRIAGYMPTFAPADADWSDEDVEEYVRRRERIDLGLLDGLSDDQVATLEANGFSADELAELRDLTAEHYRWMREEPGAARETMDVWVDPMVLITGRVP